MRNINRIVGRGPARHDILRPPRRRGEEAGARGFEARERTTPPDATLDDVADAGQDANLYYTPQTELSPVSEATESGVSGTLNPTNLGVTADILDKSGGDTSLNLSVNRQGVTGTADYIRNGVDYQGSVMGAPGYLEFDAFGKANLGDNRIAQAGTWVALWKDFVGAAVSGTVDISGVTAGGSVYLGLIRDSDVRWLGEYDGKNPSLTGQQLVEFTDKRGQTASAGAGVAMKGYGASGRVGLIKEATTVFRTHLPVDEATQALRENDEAGFFRHVLLALRLASQKQRIPDYRHPIDVSRGRTRAPAAEARADGEDEVGAAAPSEASSDTASETGTLTAPLLAPADEPPPMMKPGDELEVRLERELQLSALAGFFPIKVGALARGNCTFGLALRHLGKDRLEVTVRPIVLSQLSAFASLAELLSFDKTISKISAHGYRFEFDMTKPEARAAYEALVERQELPERLRGGVSGAGAVGGGGGIEGDEAERMLSTFARKPLCPGVQLKYVEKLEARGVRSYGGFTFFFCPPATVFPDLSRSGAHTRAIGVSTNGRNAVRHESEAQAVRKSWFGWGETTETLKVTRHELTKRTSPTERGVGQGTERGSMRTTFDGQTIQLRISEPSVWGQHQNRNLVAQLNQAFDLGVRPFHRPGRGQSRDLIIEPVVDAPAMARIGSADSQEIARVATAVRIPYAKLQQLCHGVRKVATDEELPLDTRARRTTAMLSGFTSQFGARGLGAVTRLGQCRLVAAMTSSAFTGEQGPLHRAQELALRMREGLTPEALASGRKINLTTASDQRAVQAFFEKACRILQDADDGLRDLPDDPLLDVIAGGDVLREQWREELQDCRTTLGYLLDLKGQGFSVEERAQILDKVDVNKLSSLRERLLAIESRAAVAPEGAERFRWDARANEDLFYLGMALQEEHARLLQEDEHLYRGASPEDVALAAEHRETWLRENETLQRLTKRVWSEIFEKE